MPSDWEFGRVTGSESGYLGTRFPIYLIEDRLATQITLPKSYFKDYDSCDGQQWAIGVLNECIYRLYGENQMMFCLDTEVYREILVRGLDLVSFQTFPNVTTILSPANIFLSG